jgi:toxoflavin synthase
MSTQYNLSADQYDISFQLIPFRLHVEANSVFNVLGDVTGLDILDLATGTGFYARALKQRGAARVVGVDIAEQMIQVALGAEQAEPLGIEYHAQDAIQYQSATPFDLVLAVYLLHYAPTKEILQMMCRAIAANVKSGGRFVTYQLNPEMAREKDYYKALGLNVSVPETRADGEPVPFSVTMGDITMPEVMAYRWEKDTVEAALQGAGFTDIRWIEPMLSSEGEQQYGAESFAHYMKHPHAVLIECVKA